MSEPHQKKAKLAVEKLPATQKACIVDEMGATYRVDQVSVPVPGPDQILVKVHMTGVCHTDLHAAEGDWPVKPKMPLIGGHEGAGEIVALGQQVDPDIYRLGDKVGIVWLHSACGACEYCVKGHETVCPKQHNSGYSVDGSFQQYALATASHVARIPEKLSYEQAAPILCAGVTTYKALKETEVKPGETVAIVGAGGGLGHLAIQYAVAMGLRVIAIDSGDAKKDLCIKLKADAFIDFMKENTVEKVMKLTNGQGAHGVLVLATNNKAFSDAVAYSRRYGTMVCVGLPPGNMGVPIFDIVLKRISLRGSIVGTRQDLQEALDFAANGQVKCIIRKRTLDDLVETFEEMKKGEIAGRIVLDCSK